MNCSNIGDIVIGEKLGEGWKREVFAGDFHGRKVAVKVAYYEGEWYNECRSANVGSEHCLNRARVGMLYDIALQQQLNHPSIVKMLGYCIRDASVTKSGDPIPKRGMISVFEFGEKFNASSVRSFNEMLQLSLDLLDMMDFFVNSPIGPIYIYDFGDSNLMVVDGHLKASDIESGWSIDMRCWESSDCDYNLECVEGECIGNNARAMLDIAKDCLRVLLAPEHSLLYRTELLEINTLLDDESSTLAELRTHIKKY